MEDSIICLLDAWVDVHGPRLERQLQQDKIQERLTSEIKHDGHDLRDKRQDGHDFRDKTKYKIDIT